MCSCLNARGAQDWLQQLLSRISFMKKVVAALKKVRRSDGMQVAINNHVTQIQSYFNQLQDAIAGDHTEEQLVGIMERSKHNKQREEQLKKR